MRAPECLAALIFTRGTEGMRAVRQPAQRLWNKNEPRLWSAAHPKILLTN